MSVARSSPGAVAARPDAQPAQAARLDAAPAAGPRAEAHRPAQVQPAHEGRNGDVEVLRAVAILFTLVMHWVWPLFGLLGPAGKAVQQSTAFWTGVDLFFCISGFVIAESLLRSGPIGRGWPGFVRLVTPFWIRRIYRLLPSAWFWIAASIALSFAFDAHGYFGHPMSNIADGLAAVLDVANFRYQQCVPAGSCGDLGIYWSLSLEEQFYLALPILMFALGVRGRLVLVLGALCLLQMFVPRPNGFLPQEGSPLWFVRTDAIILGVLLACWKQHPSYASMEPTFLRHRVTSALLFALMLALLAMLASQLNVVSFSTGLVAVVCAVLVWVASYDRDYLMRRSFAKAILEWVGARSYAMYLTHVIGYALCLEAVWIVTGDSPRNLGAMGAAIVLGGAFAVTAVLSELNFRLLETPLRLRGRRIARDWLARFDRSHPQPGPRPLEPVHPPR